MIDIIAVITLLRIEKRSVSTPNTLKMRKNKHEPASLALGSTFDLNFYQDNKDRPLRTLPCTSDLTHVTL